MKQLVCVVEMLDGIYQDFHLEVGSCYNHIYQLITGISENSTVEINLNN